MPDILRAARPASVSVAIGAAAMLATRPMINGMSPAFVRLVTESVVLCAVYLFSLFFIMGQRSVYMGLFREMGFWPLGDGTGEPRV